MTDRAPKEIKKPTLGDRMAMLTILSRVTKCGDPALAEYYGKRFEERAAEYVLAMCKEASEPLHTDIDKEMSCETKEKASATHDAIDRLPSIVLSRVDLTSHDWREVEKRSAAEWKKAVDIPEDICNPVASKSIQK